MKPSSIVLLQLCSLHVMVLAMPTCQVPGHVVLEAHHLLRDLCLKGGKFPVHCLPYNVNISFPGSALQNATVNHTQCRRVLWVVNESLKGAQILFENHEVPLSEGGLTWDYEKLDNFQNIQNRLLEVGSCLPSIASGVLSSYFGNVTLVLQQQDSAACGWTALRRDLLRVLHSAIHKHHDCFKW